MSVSSAADWCRAVLQEVSPINNIPLPVQGHVPPPPPPVYTGRIKKKEAPAASVAQPSAQYQAYYNSYYDRQAAYDAATAATAAAAAVTTSAYSQYQQQQTQQAAAATTAYQQTTNQYNQTQTQQLQAQQQQQQLQAQQNAYYQQQQQQAYPTAAIQETSAWGGQAQLLPAQGLRQTQMQQQSQRTQQVHGQQGQGGQGGATVGFNQQQAANAQQYSQQQYAQQAQQSQYTQQQQYSPYSSTDIPLAAVGNNYKAGATTGEVKKTKSRFSAASASQSLPAANPDPRTYGTSNTGVAAGAYDSSYGNSNGNGDSYSNGNSNGNGYSNGNNSGNGSGSGSAKPSASSAESAKPANWPASLKKFVDRSFALCKTDEDRKLVAQSLERLINRVAFDGRVTTHRWELEDVSTIIFPPKSDYEKQSEVDREREKEKENREREKDRERERERERAKKSDHVAQTTSFRYDEDGNKNGSSGGTYGAKVSVSTDYNGHRVPGPGYSSSPANSRYGPGSGPQSAMPSPAHSDHGNGNGTNVDGSRKRKNRWDVDNNSDNGSSNGNNGNVSVKSDSFYSVYSTQTQQQNGKYDLKAISSNDKYDYLKTTSNDKYDNYDDEKYEVKVKNKKTKNDLPSDKLLNRALTKAEQATRDKRADRFKEEEKVPEKHVRYTALESQSHIQFGKKNKMKKKFTDSAYYGQADSQNFSTVTYTSELDFESLIVIGTSQKIEKDYFRLTSAPLPNTVRPEIILRQTLVLLKDKWDKNEAEYVYMCSQFKSMRQDLTVQHITNDLTVEVYECHARVALESRDLNEYNQCQTQLKQLYSTMKIKKIKCKSEMEFTAYRILYYVYLQGNKKYQNGSSDLADIMQSLSQDAFKDPAVSHALLVRKSIQLDNYHKFFQLSRITPNLGNCILDLMIDNKRLLSLQKIVRGYKPNVPVGFVSSVLNFENDDEGKEFMGKAGCVLEEINEMNGLGISTIQLNINTKDSVVDTSVILTQEKLLL